MVKLYRALHAVNGRTLFLSGNPKISPPQTPLASLPSLPASRRIVTSL